MNPAVLLALSLGTMAGGVTPIPYAPSRGRTKGRAGYRQYGSPFELRLREAARTHQAQAAYRKALREAYNAEGLGAADPMKVAA